MGLGKYLHKRHFKETPEPKGKKKAARSKRLAFVVQEHHASRLHYDFRIELDGVLKSWAVPKGPSMNPHDHHLAVHVEDHPYEYRTFEGVIPEGNYGAGNVIIWDEGWYEARAGKPEDSEKTLRQELKKGHLTFVLHGKKLQGEFALIQMHGDEEKNWLLIKKGDSFASQKDVTTDDTSVISHKKVDDITGADMLKKIETYPKKAAPWHVQPMLCTLVDEPFSQDGWLFEIKWDGYRAIGTKKGSAVQLYSRMGNSFIEKFPPVVEALKALPKDAIVDGEVAVVDADGNPHFEWLQNWQRSPQGQLRYYLFDILWCNGHDVRVMPLLERKQLLEQVIPKDSVLRFSDHILTKGKLLFKEMQKRGLEGMVAKRTDSEYQENDRGAAWLKIKTHQRQEVVIGGYTEPRGSRKYLGSLLVGVYKKGKLVYVGHSGGGIPDAQRKALQQKLAQLERKTSPFSTSPRPNAPVHWVKPEVVCEMSFSEWTSEGSMRQPEFKGIREDKKAAAVHREEPKDGVLPPKSVGAKAAKEASDQPELTHLDKIFFPKYKYTKGSLVDYYTSVADYILPYLQDRPCSMLRMPDGLKGQQFFQKNNEHLPSWVPHADIFSDSNNADLRWIVGGDLPTLLYMVQLGCIEINPWNSRVGHLDKPDWLVIDLDPEGVNFNKVITVARTVKEVCDEWKLPSYPKTSGKTGIHIYIPLGAKYSYEQAKNFAHLFVLEVNKRQPKLTSIERMPAKRPHKIYLDFLQNREGQTLAAPYSVRPTPEATVAMPLHWDEVHPGLKPTDFTIKNALKRLDRTGDLWKPVIGKGIDLQKIVQALQE